METPVISIVDDDDYMRVATDTLLRSHGYTAHSFASAEDFLKSGLAETSACVISDIQMPVMDGFALQAALRAKGCMVPIIFITAFPNPATEARARKTGAVCILNKPFDSEVLTRCLESALKGGSGDHDKH